MGKLDIGKLNALYNEGEQCDQPLYSEQRSNVLLVAGDHYVKKNSKFWNRIRDNKQLSSETKLRLTKNHVQKIVKTYLNNILAAAPGTTIVPHNEKELQDQKVAELNLAVWQDIKNRSKIKTKTREWAKDFIDIGETAVKIFFDPNAGQFLGYEAKMVPEVVDEMHPELGVPTGNQVETGQMVPALDEQGNMVPSEKAVFSGELVFERIFGFNLIRAPEAKNMWESRFLCYRKMVQISDLKASVGDDEEKLKLIKESSKDVYTVFDGSSGNYQATKDQTMLREFYFRPCADYPQGYFYITTEQGILWEGILPGGVFPIVYAGFDEIATAPRSHSIIKQLRPYQAEVNRSASKIAEHQVTLGDDKLLIQSGTKVAHGGQLPGVRAIQYTGMQPGFLAGRSGEQYLPYMNSQIQEMYDIANVAEDSLEQATGQLDPYTLLFRSMKNKKKFVPYAEKFEAYLVTITETALTLAKFHYDDKLLIPAIGRREFINIPEFKSSQPLGYQIKVEPQSDDIESQMGKQIVLNHALQYVGKDLGKDGIGRALRAMPFLNKEEAFGDLTIDYDNATNDILALDRGQYRPAKPNENHPYIIKRLGARQKLGDYEFLPPQIQALYDKKINEHETLDTMQQQKILAAKADMIPSGGYLVVCDVYKPDPANPEKTKRVRLPFEAVNWLIKRLEDQGSSLDRLEGMQQSAVADMATMMLKQNGLSPGGGSMGGPMQGAPSSSAQSMPMRAPPPPGPSPQQNQVGHASSMGGMNGSFNGIH